MCRERQGKRCETDNGYYGKHPKKRFGALHCVCPLPLVTANRSYLQMYLYR